MSAALETELLTLQTKAERLREQGGSEPTALTQEEATEFSELAKSILRLTLTGRYLEPVGSWLIPGTDKSTVSHIKQRLGDSDFKTELIHYWISEHLATPWLAVITDEQFNNVPIRVRVEVQRPYLPSRILSYSPVEQS